MKIALGQINPTIGDIAGNARKISDAIATARRQGARLIIFPELSLVGYPPRDLLLKAHLVEANLAALETLARETSGDIAAIVGYVDRNPGKVGRPLHNSLAVMENGQIIARKHKTLLPTYDVFDEARYFEPGEPAVVVTVAGRRLGLSVCEDIWNPDNADLRALYPHDPIAALAPLHPDLIINISASPFVLGKHHERIELLRRQTGMHGVPVVYCNQVGGNDELIFDGASMALDATGRVIGQARDFQEDIRLIDVPLPGDAAAEQAAANTTDANTTAAPADAKSTAANAAADVAAGQDGSQAAIVEVRSGVAALHAALLLGLGDYFRKCGFCDAVLGLSGGIDSAVVCCLAAEALGPKHVTAVAMPSRYSSRLSTDDARLLAANLGTSFRIIPIDRLHGAYEEVFAEIFAGLPPNETEENIQSRIRGALLMAVSNKFGSLLLATGNKSELATGYCTLYGDMCGGIAPIGDVPKTMVYELARYINRHGEVIPETTISRPPTAELKPDQNDQDTLPPYDVLDRIVQMYVEEMCSLDDIVAAGVDEQIARWTVRRIDCAEFKRRQAAPTLKVTGRAFGMGRRMPVAQQYRLHREDAACGKQGEKGSPADE